MKSPMKSDVFPTLHALLEDHLALFPLPQRACACVGKSGNKLKLSVRFAANASAWSHATEAHSLPQAIAKLRGKLRKDLEALATDPELSTCGLGVSPSGGFHPCANAGSCPNRVLDSDFFEAAVTEPHSS